MSLFTVDPNKTDLQLVFPDWHAITMRILWDNYDEYKTAGITSKDIYDLINENLPGTISRASVINFLNGMVGREILRSVNETCKGGTRLRYFPDMSETVFKKQIIRETLDAFSQNWPNEMFEHLRE